MPSGTGREGIRWSSRAVHPERLGVLRTEMDAVTVMMTGPVGRHSRPPASVPASAIREQERLLDPAAAAHELVADRAGDGCLAAVAAPQEQVLR
jgi:hypothetical protein